MWDGGGETGWKQGDWLEGYCSNPGERSWWLVLHGSGRGSQEWLDSRDILKRDTGKFPGAFRSVVCKEESKMTPRLLSQVTGRTELLW